jgi:3-oxoacyl-[acyl-carrier protein] reductase
LAADGFAVAINTHPDPEMSAAAERVAADIRMTGGRAVVVAGDVSCASSVENLFGACEAKLGQVDTLILNAAARARRPWTQIDEAEWDHICAVNLKGAFLCARRAFGRTEAPSCGAIVTISSVQAELGAAGVLHYATTKAGLLGFTRSLARELGPRGVRVNCVMPGAIQTEEELESFPDQTEVQRKLMELQSLRQRGLPEDVAGAVSFLVGADSRFITGQTLCVDGGWVMR